MPGIVVVADDLSGASETAAAILGLGSRPLPGTAAGRVLLWPRTSELDSGSREAVPDNGTRILVVDTGSRHLDPAEASIILLRVLTSCTAGPGEPPLIVKKIDSLLRGNTAAELRTLAARGPLAVASALPAQDRSSINGIVRVSGVPLHESTAWAGEGAPAPTNITALFREIPTHIVDLSTVRGSPAGLAAAFEDCFAAGIVPVIDAETDSDLSQIARVALEHPDAVFAGSSGLAAALGTLLAQATPDATTGTTPRLPDRAVRDAPHEVIVVVGTAEPSAALQLKELQSHGAVLEILSPETHPSPIAVPVQHETTRVLALGISGPMLPGPAARERLLRTLARHVVDRGETSDLVLTGGETARSVLDALGETHLTPLAEIQHGAILSRTGSGRLVATRPGSFGGSDSLVSMVAALLESRGAPGLAPEPTDRKDQP